MANTDKELSAGVTAGTSIAKNTGKHLSSSVIAGSALSKEIGKNIIASVESSVSLSRGIEKNITANASTSNTMQKAIGKNISTSINVTALKEINSATITMVYIGNYELGLGSEEGSKFNIEVTGTFETFTIAVNDKSLTYTESCTDETITIDNVNATVKNGTTNKLSKVTGDVADFLKLTPGDNVIVYSKTGSYMDIVFNFSPLYI